MYKYILLYIEKFLLVTDVEIDFRVQRFSGII